MLWYSDKYTSADNNTKNYSWVTLLSDNSYINGVIVLDRSLKETNSKYPLCVAVTNEVSEENIQLLHKLNISVVYFETVVPPGMSSSDSPDIITSLDVYGWHKALCKIRVFSLEQFDKIVFIDADMIVKNNMDELFDMPHMTACRDCWDFDGNFGDTFSLNSGLMVIEPDAKITENLLKFLIDFDSQGKMIHDQWLIQEYYLGWMDCSCLHLSPYYGIWTTRFNEAGVEYYYHMHKIKCIHMIDRKPWATSKEYFLGLMDDYPIYSKLCLQYIDIINFTQ